MPNICCCIPLQASLKRLGGGGVSPVGVFDNKKLDVLYKTLGVYIETDMFYKNLVGTPWPQVRHLGSRTRPELSQSQFLGFLRCPKLAQICKNVFFI